MAVHICLIRAVNVGGGGKLPMAELRAACAEAGFADVRTYIASGNLILSSDERPAAVQARLLLILAERFAQPKPAVILRSPEALRRTIVENPFPEAAAERPHLLHVAFLDGAPAPDAAEKLAARDLAEPFRFVGDALYIDYLDGAGRSKLTPAVINRAVEVAQTARNWNTTLKLAALTEG